MLGLFVIGNYDASDDDVLVLYCCRIHGILFDLIWYNWLDFIIVYLVNL